MVLGEGIVQRFLTNILSAYFENIDADNLSVAVVRGDVSLSQVQLRKSVVKHLGFNALRLVNGSVGSLRAKVPWTRFGAAPIVFELDNLFVLVEADEESAIESVSELEAKLKESFQEVIQEVSTSGSNEGGSWGGWLASAGRIAKRLIDYIEIQIKINNVHIRYSSDSFTAGAVFESLSLSTTTQQAAPKTLSLQKLAFYCNPLQDAIEDDTSRVSPYQYILEPVSGSVHLSFPSASEISIQGQFDSVQFKFDRDQLNPSIWAELKAILIATKPDAPASPKQLTSDPVSTSPANTGTRIRVSFALGKAVVKAICLPVTASREGSIDLVGEELFVSGDVGVVSELKFRMKRMTIQNEKKSLISTSKSSANDFVQIMVKTSDDKKLDIPIHVEFKLGPVIFDFHPVVVGSLIAFLKSFSGPTEPSPAAPKTGKVQLQFYWESMQVNWYQIISDRLFAKSSMSASFISLELLPSREFIARGELGDFSIDHVIDESVSRPMLSLADTRAGYLFKFLVRSFDDDSGSDFPGYYTQIEFDLSAVQLVIVRTTLLRFWNYIFDGFLPAITGDLTAGSSIRKLVESSSKKPSYDEDDDDDFKSVSSRGSPAFSPRRAAAESTDKRRPYLLAVTVAALELVVPVSATTDEVDPLSIELRKLTIKNQGAEGEIDVIDFELEEVHIECMSRILSEKIRVESKLFRQQPMLISTSLLSPSIVLDRHQFCRLCEILDNNILANASDGVVEDSPISPPPQIIATDTSLTEWLKFDFKVPEIHLAIDDSSASRISLRDLQLGILKYTQPKSVISVDCQQISLCCNSRSIGVVPALSVRVDSEITNRSILVTVTEPTLDVQIGILSGLKAYFFDAFSRYESPAGIRRNSIVPQTVAGWETVLNVNLLNAKLFVVSHNETRFSVGARILSFHQGWQSSEERLIKKFVLSGAAVHYLSSDTDSEALTDHNLIVANLDLFLSSTIEHFENEIEKFNCEPVNVRLSFSHLRALQYAIDLQRIQQTSEPRAVVESSPALTVNRKRQLDVMLSSVSLLLVNDFAALQNTPLFSVVVRNLETAISSVRSVKDGSEHVKRESLNLLVELSIAYFNKTSVTWEPLIEALTQGENGSMGRNEKFVKFTARKSVIEFSSNLNPSERSAQSSFELGDAGIQINITEALLQSVLENWRHWSSQLSLSRKKTQPPLTAEDRVVFSPYSVRNMTGEPEIRVIHKDLRFCVRNKDEEPLTGVAVVVDNEGSAEESHRVFVRVESDSWTLPRVPLDKPGVYLYRVAGDDELVGRVTVTEDGRKVLSLESTILVLNQFGSDLRLKLSNDSETEIIPGQSVAIPACLVNEGQFRLTTPGGAWSGQVSLPDIRARNDSKLWQMNIDGQFVYLSGSKARVAYQDKQTSQFTVSVFAPVRLKSTLPTLIDYQIIASTGAAAAGTIGLNGQEFISSVPLTGRLELRLSLFDGRCVCSVQVWPVPTVDLEQDASSKQYFLPVELGSSLELRLLYESVSVKPPELTIHTGQWLVCLDVPTQLRFVYADGLDDWAAAIGASEPVVVEIPRGEKTYSAPLHARSKTVSAFLNKTRSESVLVDTIGASGQITLDAFDESSKSKVKQDLAVRVSSAPSGVVRDLPVKITTVCPKYVIVNMLDEQVFVRQLGNASFTGTVSARPGEQVPFRWWTVTVNSEDGSEMVSRYLQIRTGDVWSGRIKMSEIGESLVRGIDNVRAEIRIYHGGFYLVLSKAFPRESDPSSPVKSSSLVSNEVYQVILPSLSVSVVGPAASRNATRCELLLLDIKNLLVTVSLSPVGNELDLRMQSIQMDDLRDEPKFPVVFTKATAAKRASSSPPPELARPPELNSAAELFVAWLPPGDDTVLNFESFVIRSADANLCIDYSLISDLTAMFISCLKSASVGPTVYPYKFDPVMEKLPVGSLRIWSFKEFLLSPMKVNLSFNTGGALGDNFSVVHRAISSMASVERSPIAFQALVLSKFRASRSNVMSVIAEHYKYELYREMRTIMGSAEAFGNPIGLMSSVSAGVNDLVQEPLAAWREYQGPEDMANVADKTAKGAKSFLRNTAFGVFNSFSKLAATSAQTLSILAEDDEFLAERSDFHNKNKPAHFGDGVVVGAASFGRGVMSGLSGLVTKPVEGLEQEGIAGFARGAFKGVGGFFLKPMAGFFDFAKSAADGVVSSTKDAALDSNQIRLPRMLYSHDRVIRVVNPEHSLLRWYLSQLESMPPNFSYSAHVYDSQNGLLIALSSEHLVAADTKNQRLCLLVPLWRVLGVTTDLDHLVLSVNVQVPPQDVSSPSSAQGTSRVDFELSSVAVVKSVQQVVAKAMEW